MKERIQGLMVGVLIGAICTGGAVFAKTAVETIEVSYDNIKVYKDNVLCELKDANGSVIEPFIYNGTTYMPVRGTASIADMEVTWDGTNKSVYLWDTMVPDGTFLLDVCPPYAGYNYSIYLASEGRSFSMSGKSYSNGIELGSYSGNALFNLDSKYSVIECTIGHTDRISEDKTVSFIVDGKVVMTVELESECMPKTISVPVSYGLQLKIQAGDGNRNIGIGNITVK